MKKFRSLLALLLVAVMAMALLAGCGGPQIPGADSGSGGSSGTSDSGTGGGSTGSGGNTGSSDTGSGDTGTAAPAELTFAPGTVLRMACGYNSASTGLFFDPDTAGDGVTLADGNTYLNGQLKPTWVEVENKLGMKFENKYQGNSSATKEFEYWQEQLDQVDMVAGGATILNAAGVAGKLVNIAEYLDMMPNFKAYLDANPIVKLSIIGDTSNGAIYYSPYFDGVDDIERMPLMRTDWVEKLLNGEGEFTADASKNIAAPVYQPYMPTTGKVTVDVANADGTAVEQVTKDYDTAGNIIEKMNAAGTISGVEAVNMLRTYIDQAYGGYYGTNRADLFIGQNAAWDADELVALLRCVVANPQTLNGTDTIQGIFSREDDNNQRRVDMFRFAGTLFGVRGLESRLEYLYVGADGKLHDARQEPATYQAMERMNQLVQEGLISKAFVDMSAEKTETYLENDLGFMHYDYNQTQTIYNATKLDNAAGEEYRPVMVPVARWDDGTGEQFMRFTESWRSVKTDGWAISKAGVEGSQDKLYAALKLIDFAYSTEGQILMSYGPDAFIKTNADGSYVTFNFNGEQWPEIADATREELWSLANGNYTNYARKYLGSTLSFLKSQAFEFQCTQDVGREGGAILSNAIALGLIKHPLLAVADNPWYTIVPTVLPNTSVEVDQINSYTELSSNFSTSKGEANVLIDIIVKGYTLAEMNGSADGAAALVSGTWNGARYLALREAAYESAIAYYQSH